MDSNTYGIAAVLNALRQRELGLLPSEAEFTPFDLSALRQTPKRPERPQEGRLMQPAHAHVEALA